MIDSGSRCPFNDGARVPFQDSLPDVSNNAEVLATKSFVALIIGLTCHPFSRVLRTFSIVTIARVIALQRLTAVLDFVLPLGSSTSHLKPVGLAVCKIRY
jgi:hypothetical protein